MEVILLGDVDKVGLRGEVVNVARGYAQLPAPAPARGAGHAGPGRRAEAARRPARPARGPLGRAGERDRRRARKTVLSFDVKAGPTGALFGSVTTTDIADELWRTRKIRVDRKKIGTDSIRRIGRYAVPIQIFEDVTVEVKTLSSPRAARQPPEEELAAMEAAEAEAEAAKRRRPRRTAPRRRRSSRPRSPPRTPRHPRLRRPRRPTNPPRRPGDGRRRARARRGRARADVPQRAPQACGARCELPL